MVFSDWLTEVRHTRIPGLPPDEYDLRLELRLEALGHDPNAQKCGEMVDLVLGRIREAGFRFLTVDSQIDMLPGRDTYYANGKLAYREPDGWRAQIHLTLARQ